MHERSSMRIRGLVTGALAVAAGLVAAAACSSMDSADATRAIGDGGAAEGSRDGGPTAADAGSDLLQASGLVLVHAASFPAFRICFEGAGEQDRPLPDTDLMPESNVVGIDVGTAVRLPPPRGIIGRAFVYPESKLRPLYTAFGGAGAGPTCADLLRSMAAVAVELPRVDVDVSSGLHVLALVGCENAVKDPTASPERCGPGWDAATGNLALHVVELRVFRRATGAGLPVQLVQLSPALAHRSAGRALGLAFGPLDAEAGPPPRPFLEGAVPFGTPVPDPPAVIDYQPQLESYATNGLFVTLGGAVDDAGAVIDAGNDAPSELLIAQSLADIQRRSASRSLPPDWFSVASSYVVLSVGDPDPRHEDGGRDDDARRALHLLAIPLAAADAGAAPPSR